MVTLIVESTRFILSKSYFSMKVKGQLNRGTHMDKRTDTGRETHIIPSLTSQGD